MSTVNDLVVPGEFLASAKMSEKEMRVELAVHLYATKRLTMGQAKRLADLDQIAFQHELANRNVYIHMTIQDVEEDARNLGIKF